MPRKKTAGAAPSSREVRPPFAARYVRVCIGEIYRLIIERNERELSKLEAELQEFIAVNFRGEALATIKEAISWVRQLAEDFASQPVIEPFRDFADIDRGFDQTIDHDHTPG